MPAVKKNSKSKRSGLDTLGQWFLTWVRSSPRASVNQFQEFSGLVHPTRIIYDLLRYVITYICFALEGKSRCYISNYEWFDECVYGTSGVQYLQQGQEPLP